MIKFLRVGIDLTRMILQKFQLCNSLFVLSLSSPTFFAEKIIEDDGCCQTATSLITILVFVDVVDV